MATTTNYSFNKPTVGGDSDTWGTQLNSNWDDVDSLLSGGTAIAGATLTGANITATTVNLSGTVTIADASVTATIVTTDELVVTGEVRETVFAITGTTPAIDPANGTIQTWTLTGASTPSFSLASGESITLGLTRASNTITWPAIDWIGGTEPVLDATNVNWITLWQVGATLYATYAGASS